MSTKTKICIAAAVAIIAAALLIALPRTSKATEHYTTEFFINQGFVFGTYYNIRYAYSTDLHDSIKQVLQDFDMSLSTFNKQSTISCINQNTADTTDYYFEQMYKVAEKVSRLTDGAFDITIAPLVNLWGFGFQNRAEATEVRIDSIKSLVGYEKITLTNHHLIKQDQRIMLDASAVAKGYSCDVVADYLRSKGIENYLVDIGGEITLNGMNDKQQPWAVGITKPQDDLTGTQNDIQEIIHSTNLSMATSGNYRQFYYDNGVRRSHTIDPHTGYPVNHKLLSATIIAPKCAEADAIATACMVMGEEKALKLIDSIEDVECYLIVSSSEEGQYTILMSQNMGKYIESVF